MAWKLLRGDKNPVRYILISTQTFTYLEVIFFLIDVCSFKLSILLQM